MRTVYPASRAEFTIHALLSGGAAVFAIWLLTDSEIDLVPRVIHAVPVALLACAILVLTIRAGIRNLPELVLDPGGMTVAVGGEPVRITWPEIAGVRIGRYRRQETIEVVLHEWSGRSHPPRLRPGAIGWTSVDGRKALILWPARMRPHKAADIIAAMTIQNPALFIAPPLA